MTAVFLLVLFAVLTIAFWWAGFHEQWPFLFIICCGDAYIILALYTAAATADFAKAGAGANFFSLYFLPSRTFGLLGFVALFLIILFGFAGLHSNYAGFTDGRINSLYFSFTTLVTVGYGDLVPSSAEHKILVMFQMGSSVLLIAGGLSLLMGRISTF